ncbi:MAG: 50S ribosome-binding GTPase [Thermoplasmata archaeon]|nr:50S ribosome-binding GTPase [Thermoplasmata archaeon]
MFKLPDVRTPDEILESAFKRAGKVTAPKKQRVVREKQLSIAKIRTVSQYVSKEMGRYVKGFPSFDELDDFYKELLDVTISLDKLRHHLGGVDRCRKVATSIGGDSVRKIKRMNDVGRISRETKSAYGRLSSVLKETSINLEFLKDAAKEMRRIPEIDTDLPTIVIAGCPNVGKSLLVRSLSSAKPKIASYPFTTKKISIGIFERDSERYQVIDTPGLLDRPYEKRNAIERQAISALRHLANCIVFLIDPTETCGYDLKSQLNLLSSIKKDFNTPVVEVENKLDLLDTSSERMKVSALNGNGVEELREFILRLLTEKS